MLLGSFEAGNKVVLGPVRAERAREKRETVSVDHVLSCQRRRGHRRGQGLSGSNDSSSSSSTNTLHAAA